MELVRSSTHDRLSELPSNILDVILMFLPLRDATRTSILSTKWRFRWATIPQLVFDQSLTLPNPYKPRDIVRRIFEILLLHQGPILKFTLDMDQLTSSEIGKIIIFLSRNGIQEFTLWLRTSPRPRLPSYFFSCQELRHLILMRVAFKPPPTFTGFGKLISLVLQDVDLDPDLSISYFPLLERLKLEVKTTIGCLSINAPNLKCFCFKAGITQIGFINTPVLAVLYMYPAFDGFSSIDSSTFDLIKLLDSLPLVENLHMDYKIFKLLAVGNVPEKLPTMLNYLRTLELSELSFAVNRLSCALCLIRSSPNLQKLKLKFEFVSTILATDLEPVLEYLGLQDFTLNKLREVDIKCFTGLRPHLKFVKLLLAISPKLEIVRIETFAATDTYKAGYRMLKKLARYRRASPKAEIIFHGLD